MRAIQSGFCADGQTSGIAVADAPRMALRPFGPGPEHDTRTNAAYNGLRRRYLRCGRWRTDADGTFFIRCDFANHRASAGQPGPQLSPDASRYDASGGIGVVSIVNGG